MNKVAFLKGFIKAAFSEGSLTQNDIAKIRGSMQDQGFEPPYNDVYGEQSRLYNQNLLQERDRSIDKIPELEAAMAAGGHGLVGGALGAAGGAGLGSLLKHTNLVNLPHGIKANLPHAMALPAGILGALAMGVPAAKKKFDETSAMKKLNHPSNVGRLLTNIDADKNLLNS